MIAYKEAWRRKIELAVQRDLVTGCWVWTRGCDGQGYPRFRQGKAVIYAHHASAFCWLDVPMDLDPQFSRVRTCGNIKCLNPKHITVERKR